MSTNEDNEIKLNSKVFFYIEKLITNEDYKTTYYTIREYESNEEFIIDTDGRKSDCTNTTNSRKSVNSKTNSIEKMKFFKILNTASSFWENKFCFNSKK